MEFQIFRLGSQRHFHGCRISREKQKSKNKRKPKNKNKSPPVSSLLIGSKLISSITGPSHVGGVRLAIVKPHPHISFVSTSVRLPGWVIASSCSPTSPSSSSVVPPLPSHALRWHFKSLHLLPVILCAAAHRLIVCHADRLQVTNPMALLVHVGVDGFSGPKIWRRARAAAAAAAGLHG